MNEPEVLISEFSYNEQGLEELQEIDPTTSKGKLVRRYPTVYVVKDKGKARSYSVYVGETNNIVHRTSQHLHDDPKKRDDWKKLSHSRTANMYVIANKHFNKSLTLDIENRLMLYLGSVENVNALYNRRTNSQDQYYPDGRIAKINITRLKKLTIFLNKFGISFIIGMPSYFRQWTC